MVVAIVEILVTQKAAPALVADAVVRLVAGAVHAAWISYALFARGALPAKAAVALIGSGAVALILVATGETDWLLAVLALPAGQTEHLTLLRAGEMAIDIVAWPAQNVALFAVVVWLTGHSIGVD